LKRIITLPVYNEEKTLLRELEKLREYADLIIVVNDGSIDNSDEIVNKWINKNLEHIYINLKVNRGKSHALLLAFEKILDLNSKGDIENTDLIIVTDADGQLPTDIINDSVEYFSRKGLDTLIGFRDFSRYPIIKKLGNYLLSSLASILTGFHFNDTQCGYRILTVSALQRILPHYSARGYACEQELSIISVLLKMKVDNSYILKPIYYRSNSTYSDAVKITLDSFKTANRLKRKLSAEERIGSGKKFSSLSISNDIE